MAGEVVVSKWRRTTRIQTNAVGGPLTLWHLRELVRLAEEHDVPDTETVYWELYGINLKMLALEWIETREGDPDGR